MTEQRIAFHVTATTQPCTNCGEPGHWAEAGRTGYYAPPSGHTLREDGTMACPATKPNLRHLVPGTPEHDRRQADLCAYLRHHGINPDHVPADAGVDINLDKRTLSIDVLAPELGDDRRAYHGTNRTMRARRTVPLLVTFEDFCRNLATPS